MKSLKDYIKENIRTVMNSGDLMAKDHVLAVVKPGFEDLLKDIYEIFDSTGYEIVKTKTKQLTIDEAKELYKVHSKEDFYDDLCKYMSSDITTAFILKKQSNNIFKEFKKIKEKIRNEYGESDMRNVLHSSDSYESFTHEAGIYFYNVRQKDLLEK